MTVLDHHVDTREIEAFLQGAERRSDPVGEHEVGHVGIWMASPQPVAEAMQPSDDVSEGAGEDVDFRVVFS